MADIGNFDASAVEPAAPRDILPAGKYIAHIVKSEMSKTSKGGQMLELELEVIDGQFARRHFWDRLNLVNSNPQAVEIAQRTLSAICHAVGVIKVSDSEQLHFKPMLVTVKVKPAEEKYPAKNEVGGYEPANGAKAAAYTPPAASGAPAAQVATGGAKTAPWKRNAA